MNALETCIRDSQLFTQVEPEWLAESDGKVTYVNRTRGVVLKVDRGDLRTARCFHDNGKGETFCSTGFYNVEELTRWWFPVMKSNAAWDRYVSQEQNFDITEAIDFA